jgi:ribonuclease P protein component
MLPKTYRLTRVDLNHFTGRRLTSPTLHLIFSPSSLPHSRAAVVISKRVMVKAHDRNRLKRVISHTIAPHFSTPPFYDFLIIAQTKAAHVPEPQVLSDLAKLFHQIQNPKS